MKILTKTNTEDWDSIKALPLLDNLKGYNKGSFFADIKSGFNVAVLSFPVNMAYALVAGLPISYGIFCGIVCSVLAMFFCKSVYVTFGPSNATAVILFSSFAVAGLSSEAEHVKALPNILLFVGVFLALASIFKLTFVISYISRTVIIAYVSVGALLIGVNQMRNLLGFNFIDGEVPTTFIETFFAVCNNISNSKPESIALAVLTMFIFIPLKKYFKKLPAEAITLILIAVICYVAIKFFNLEVDRLSAVAASQWQLSFPDFSQLGLKDSASAALAIALLCTIESFSIGKSLASQNADRYDTNQETFSLGIANMACALTSSTLTSGSLTRSTLAVKSGAKTTMFNLFTAIFTVLILLSFGNAIEYIPKATLALIVVYTSISLISIPTIKLAIKSTFADATVFFLTFFVGIFSSLDNAIYTGIIVSILLFLKKASTPELIEYSIGDDGQLERLENKKKQTDPEISIVHVEGNMFFGASDILQNQLRRISAEKHVKVLILKLRNAINVDATSVLDLKELKDRMHSSGRLFILCEVRQETLDVLKKSGALNFLGEDNVFVNDEENPTLSAAQAIKYAKTKLKGQKTRLTIYAND